MGVQFTEVKPPVTIEKLHEVEKSIGRNLPQQYQEFLLRHNGGRPKPSWFRIQWSNQEWAEGWNIDQVHFFLSIYDGSPSDFLDYYDTFKGRIPDDTVAIAYDPGGNLILLGTAEINRGKVFFWMHSYETDEDEKADYSNVGFVANSLNEFIESLFENE